MFPRSVVTVTSPSAAWLSVAVNVTLSWFSLISDVLSAIVNASLSSVTDVVTVLLDWSIIKFSKFPPVADTIVADISPASIYTSSLGASTITVPSLWPAAIVIVIGLLLISVISKVTVTASLTSAGSVNVAVYVIVVPSTTVLVASRLTLTSSISSLIVPKPWASAIITPSVTSVKFIKNVSGFSA